MLDCLGDVVSHDPVGQGLRKAVNQLHDQENSPNCPKRHHGFPALPLPDKKLPPLVPTEVASLIQAAACFSSARDVLSDSKQCYHLSIPIYCTSYYNGEK
jgi:hypothetical protein